MTVFSSIITQSCILERGDILQLEPMRTHDPIDMDCIVQLFPILVCEPMIVGRAFSLSVGGITATFLPVPLD